MKLIKAQLKKLLSLYSGEDNFDILSPPTLEFGDYSTNLAFVLAKRDKKKPTEVGEKLIQQFSGDREFNRYFSKIELAGAGFVNFYLTDDFLREKLNEILNKKDRLGSQENKKIKINLEFVSANPTGPLTVANVRAASFGDALANIFKKNRLGS